MTKEVDRWEDEPDVDGIDEIDWDSDGERWVPVETDRSKNDPRQNKAELLREIRYIYKMQRRGKSTYWIADEMGRSQSWVVKRIKQGIDLYRPPGVEEDRVKAIARCEEEYEDVREAIRAGEIDLDKGMAALDRIERRRADLLGTRAPKKFADVSEPKRARPSSPVIAEIQAEEADRRAKKEAEWARKRKKRADGD